MEAAMAMEATTIRFEPEEKSWIQAYADFVGRTFSDVVREAALEAVEAAADRQAYQDALAADDGIRYSTDDVMRMALEAE
ncbi:type II toxin-antitoxin system RelB family antitoxin [Atopobiaceae bacterium Sow4_H2]